MSLAITSLCKLNVTNGGVKSQKMKSFCCCVFLIMKKQNQDQHDCQKKHFLKITSSMVQQRSFKRESRALLSSISNSTLALLSSASAAYFSLANSSSILLTSSSSFLNSAFWEYLLANISIADILLQRRLVFFFGRPT